MEYIQQQKKLLPVRKRAIASRSGGRTFDFKCKRVLDIFISISALLFIWPLLLLIAIAIRLDSPGAALFVQNRVGSRRCMKNGEETWEICRFPIFKFRTMARDADQSLHKAHIQAFASGKLPGEGENANFKLVDDVRITRIGKLLRITSLDELPQVFNVLRGDMSLVGPRPVPEYEVEQYQGWHFERLHALPGITGYWQVFGRSKVTFDEMAQMDIEYVRHRSVWRDIKLLILTVPAVLAKDGAG